MTTEEINGKRFYVDGDRKYISVTTAIATCTGSDKTESLMEWSSRFSDYKIRRNDAAKFGTRMHTVMENMLMDVLYGLSPTITQEDLEGFVLEGLTFYPYDPYKAYIDAYSYFKETLIDVIELEFEVKSDKLGLAGRIDCLIKHKVWGNTLVDFKFSKTPRQNHDHRLQLATYSYMLRELGVNVDKCINFFPNLNNKQGFTISCGHVEDREVELVAELARIRLEL